MARRAMSAAALAVSVLVTACQSPAAGDAGRVRVVASTNVYGSIAATIGGPGVDVTSIIEDPSQDPHSYQANARAQLALSKADIVLENGGGYDDFVQTMLSSVNSHAVVIDAVTVSGKKADADLNEHVWYDVPSVQKVVEALVTDLSARDESAAPTFRRNAAAFVVKLRALRTTEASIKTAHAGTGVAITEPVPLYMLSACGLVNRTQPQFSAAIEQGDGVPIRLLDQTVALFAHHVVALLAYNQQTSGQETDTVVAAAKRNGVPAIGFTETLPRGADYARWMAANLASIKAALA